MVKQTIEISEKNLKRLKDSGELRKMARLHKLVFDVYRDTGFTRTEALELTKFVFGEEGKPFSDN